jgi:hypothetical protein
VGAVHPLHIWIHPLGICKISRDIHADQPAKNTCDTLPNPRVASFETMWLETTDFQKYNMYMQYFLCNVVQLKCCFEVLTKALFTLMHIHIYIYIYIYIYTHTHTHIYIYSITEHYIHMYNLQKYVHL